MDDEVKVLIEMWGNSETSFNMDHPLHFNNNEGRKGLLKINGQLSDMGINYEEKKYTTKQQN